MNKKKLAIISVLVVLIGAIIYCVWPESYYFPDPDDITCIDVFYLSNKAQCKFTIEHGFEDIINLLDHNICVRGIKWEYLGGLTIHTKDGDIIHLTIFDVADGNFSFRIDRDYYMGKSKRTLEQLLLNRKP